MLLKKIVPVQSILAIFFYIFTRSNITLIEIVLIILPSFSFSDNIEDMSEDNEGDEDSDKAEIKEFLRNVRSHGSFKLILGDSVVEPRRESKNPLERVANT